MHAGFPCDSTVMSAVIIFRMAEYSKTMSPVSQSHAVQDTEEYFTCTKVPYNGVPIDDSVPIAEHTFQILAWQEHATAAEVSVMYWHMYQL